MDLNDLRISEFEGLKLASLSKDKPKTLVIAIPSLLKDPSEDYFLLKSIYSAGKNLEIIFPLLRISTKNIYIFLEKLDRAFHKLMKFIKNIMEKREYSRFITAGYSLGGLLAFRTPLLLPIEKVVLICSGSLLIDLIFNESLRKVFELARGEIATALREEKVDALIKTYDPYYLAKKVLVDVFIVVCKHSKEPFTEESSEILVKILEKRPRWLETSVKTLHLDDIYKLDKIFEKILL